MEVSIIKIGNSKGLRLSKAIIDKYNIKDKVELILENDKIILKPLDEPRNAPFKRNNFTILSGVGLPRDTYISVTAIVKP
jgi:antitoxin component of MazEF toxin-antitoxin module